MKLAPEESGEINWQIRVEDAAIVNNPEVGKFSVESYIEAEAEQAGEISGTSRVTTETIVNSVISDLTLKPKIRYYNQDDLALGLGPIEPKVGEESCYNVKLELINNLHNITDIEVVVKLPKGKVSWSNKESHDTGDLFYNSGSNTVRWRISRLAKTARTAEASFNISITPEKDDLGRVLILISEINLEAEDADTGSEISKEYKALTTSFQDPILGQTVGVVE